MFSKLLGNSNMESRPRTTGLNESGYLTFQPQEVGLGRTCLSLSLQVLALSVPASQLVNGGRRSCQGLYQGLIVFHL